MIDQRPDPDELLSRLQQQEMRDKRGMLKIFFGFAPGVGKTYAMLQEAKIKQKEGIEVVAGIVETHGRRETESLLSGIEIISKNSLEYRGVTIEEFDLDGVLNRKPALVLVDELAHTNAPGSRHAKRWQDIEELLQAGINVFTTLNVQHLESLNDAVSQITGIKIRETVPDSMLERADELELVDLSPEELMQRLQEGKVYVPDQAIRAVHNFFRKGNLIALRELSLRQTADRVGAQMRHYKQEKSIDTTWPTGERILVGVSPSPTSARLVRAAFRMAESLHAEWFAVYIETPLHRNLPQADQDRVIQNLRLASQLGAHTATISGTSPREVILSYAHEHNITKIVMGKPLHRRWRDILYGSVVDELIWHCGDIDIYVITGEGNKSASSHNPPQKKVFPWKEYLWAAAGTGFCSVLAWLMFPYFAPANLIMTFLLGVIFCAQYLGKSPAMFASILSVLVFDYFFIPPYLTLAVADTQYVVTLLVMLFISSLISTQMNRIRYQAITASKHERQTAALFEMSQKLNATQGLNQSLKTAADYLSQFLNGNITFFIPDENRKLTGIPKDGFFDPDKKEQSVAQWVYEQGQIAGVGTDTLSGAQGTFFPLRAANHVLGVLRLEKTAEIVSIPPEKMQFIEAFCNLIALAIERENLSKQVQATLLQVETERMRNILLSSVSHDLRTPLTTIAGSASSLLDEKISLDSPTRQELTQMIFDEAQRLDRLVGNLLEMSRLQSGTVKLNMEWHVLGEIVGSAINSLHQQLVSRSVLIKIADDMPLVYVDALLMERVFYNLLDNAIKYTPADSSIEITGQVNENTVQIKIVDHGKGFLYGEENQIFQKFYQTTPEKKQGIGLGLTICRCIMEAHGGQIQAKNCPDGGAEFCLTLPQTEKAPCMDDLATGTESDAIQ